jgi:3-dehydroquinate dehydratase-2
MSARSILMVSGPNLNLLGTREPEIYGELTLDQIVESARREAEDLGWSVEHRQSNSSAEIVSWVQESRHSAIVINPGAFTHYAWSIHDALKAYQGIVVEVHLSNPLRRESWRHQSVVAPVADGTIAGFGALGYAMAVRAVASLAAH